MKIFSAEQIRAWDDYTIRHEPVASVDLMERAATACAAAIRAMRPPRRLDILCGTGNNGGDGLAIARLLASGHDVRVLICGDPLSGSPDFRINRDRLPESTVVEVLPPGSLPAFRADAWCIDALLGTGINRTVDGWFAEVIEALNGQGCPVIAIDLPSGLLPDATEPQTGAVVRARSTLTFGRHKLAFLFPENQQFTGDIHVLDIGLHPAFESDTPSPWQCMDAVLWNTLVPLRPRAGHKRSSGHVQVIGGSRGRIGAAVLCARGVLRGSAGLVTVTVPQCGYEVVQSAFPEAMVALDEGADALASASALPEADVLAVGPGMGQAPETALMLRRLLQETRVPMVLDADALNLAGSREMLNKIPPDTILTPHPGEFDRMFGPHRDTFSRWHTQQQVARERGWVILLKGMYTTVAAPEGPLWFNLSGNTGLSTAGSGDVLTGMVSALRARGLSAPHAAAAGAFLHGRAAEEAAAENHPDHLIASDLLEYLPKAVRALRTPHTDSPTT